MRLKVFITRKIPDVGIKLLQRSCSVKIHPHHHPISRMELQEGVMWCDALLSLLTDKIDKSIININPKLKVISNYAVGFDNIDVSYATQKGIPVTNTPGVLTDAVAEHTFALMVSIARKITLSDTFTRKKRYKGWDPLLFLGTELKGKTLGIVGLGRIGSGVAQRAYQGLGMNIIYYDIKHDLTFERHFHAHKKSLWELLKESDFVTLHVPLLPSTHHLIGTKELSFMKRTAYLINTSRGAIIDEKALVAALKRQQIAGAALDVYEFEPKLTPGLEKLDNVVLTPHTASATVEARNAMAEIAANNILAIFKGKKALYTVNPEVYGKKK